MEHNHFLENCEIIWYVFGNLWVHSEVFGNVQIYLTDVLSSKILALPGQKSDAFESEKIGRYSYVRTQPKHL